MKLSQLSSLLGAALVVSAAAFSPSAFADSAVGAGGAPNTAAAHLDFTIVIPKVLQFRVGTAAAIDNVTFNVTAAQVGTGAALAATAGGDIGPGVVTAKVVANAGQVSLTAATTGALSDGAAVPSFIPWSEISTTVANLTSVTALQAPVIPLTGTGASLNAPAPTAAGITIADATWTYKYLNTTVPKAGTYGNTVAKNSRITYTATQP